MPHLQNFFIPSDGEIGELIRSMDWSKTPLGSMQNWPQSLRTIVQTILDSPIPTILGWGQELTAIYNDAYQPLLGRKHPALGKPFLEIWSEATHIIRPLIDKALAGKSVSFRDAPFTLMRYGYPEQAWFDYSYSPLRDDDGTIAGLLNIAVDTTERKLTEEACQKLTKQLDAERKRLDTILRRLPAGVMIADDAGRVHYANEYALRIYGQNFSIKKVEEYQEEWQPTHLDGRPFDFDEIPMVQALQGREIMRVEMRLPRPDGSDFFDVEVSGTPFFDDQGRVAEGLVTIIDITERKRSETALRESEERFSKAFHSSPAPMAITEIETGRVIDINTKWLQMLGYTREEIIGRTTIEIGIWANSDQRPSVIRTLRSDGSLREVTTEFVTKSGEIRHAIWSAEVIDYGGMSVMLSLVYDITERKRAEETLRESEARYRELVQNANSAIIKWKADGTVTFFNEYAQSFFGYSAEEAVGEHIGFIVPEKESTGIDLTWLVQGIVANPERYVNFVNENVRKDGSRVWMAWTNKPIFNAEGKVTEILTIGSDITERKKTEDCLRESEERYRLIQLSTKDIIWDWNLKTDEVRWDGLIENVVGIFPGELRPSRVWIDKLHSMDRERVFEKIEASIKGESNFWSDEYRFICADGKVKDILDRGYIARDAKGVAYRMIGIMQDITKRKRAEQALRDSEERYRNLVGELEVRVRERTLALDKANKSKDEFLANISHEIRTPLSGIFGLTEVLLKQPLPESIGTDLEMIRVSAASVLSLLNDMLDLSRIEQGRFELVPEHFSIRAKLDDIIRSYKHQAAEKGIDIDCSVGPEIPDLVVCDRRRLGQVIKNLLFNAIKFTESGSVRIFVRIEAFPGQPERLRFTVSDTGIGIPEEKIGDIFQTFTQVDPSYAKRFSGAGLGLAISRQLVELMGGEITAESELGRGSTFTFTVAFERAEKGLSDHPVALSLADLPSLSILLAEDNQVNRLFLKRALTAAGHRVVEAEDGRQALDKVAHTPFDIILMDIQMPEMDGLEATRRIRTGKHGRADIPIIALTAYAMKGDREKFLEGGMDGYVTKPVDFGELAGVIAEVGNFTAEKG